jgi:hypothetical protein
VPDEFPSGLKHDVHRVAQQAAGARDIPATPIGRRTRRSKLFHGVAAIEPERGTSIGLSDLRCHLDGNVTPIAILVTAFSVPNLPQAPGHPGPSSDLRDLRELW